MNNIQVHWWMSDGENPFLYQFVSHVPRVGDEVYIRVDGNEYQGVVERVWWNYVFGGAKESEFVVVTIKQ